MMIRLFKENKIPCINVVRREEQVKLLKEEYGCEHVLNSKDEKFEETLFNLSEKMGANVALECVAGDMTGIVTRCLVRNGVTIVYGQLSEQDIGPIISGRLIFMN
jgi:NADPH:quinone reductase-like Zn-dependent oxidoreductase